MDNRNDSRLVIGTLAGFLSITVWGPALAWAAEYRGAEAVLAQAAEAGAKPKATAVKVSPGAQLRADLKAFPQKAASLAPAEAATQWLALLDRFQHLEDSPMSLGRRSHDLMPVQSQEVVEALPPPEAWSALVKAAEARPAGEGGEALRTLGLKLLVHTLAGETAKRQADLSALEVLAAKAKSDNAYLFNSLFEELSRALLESLENPDLTLQVLERKIVTSQSSEGYESQLEVPDLVALVGPEKAEAFLRKALTKGTVTLTVETGTATDKLAQKLALELMGQLKRAQWSLVNSLDTVELYEAMAKRFGKETSPEAVMPIPGIPGPPLIPRAEPGNYEKQNARVYYFLGLIAKGRTTNAVAVAKQFEREVYFPTEVLRELERAGFAKELNSFFHELLQQDPELPFWDEYVQLAAHAGETAEMVRLVRTTATKPGVSKTQRARLEQLLYKALLANDEVDAGVAELRRLLESGAGQTAPRRSYAGESRSGLALCLAQIGHLLDRTNWLEEGIAAATRTLQEQDEAEDSAWGNWPAFPVVTLLEKLDRGPEAEALLGRNLANAVRLEQKAGRQRYGPMQGSEGAVQSLAGLVRLYYRAGRFADVLKVFEQAPYWGAADLADLNRRGSAMEDYDSHTGTQVVAVPVGFYAAASLAKAGRAEEAGKLLTQLLDQAPACDRLYELLLSLTGDQALARLDELFTRDQFEERPLIWKAHWLRTHQRLDEAEQAARKAISIDPTDGEEPPGDRLRAYAVLAEIRAARGDKKEADILRGAVEAVHQAEKADEFQAAGLLKRAVAMYEESLNRFADAYCIHARLAVQLSDLGRHQEAEEHYRRAYELMPDSFGRVESHCFGCERAFDGERAQKIAERVFTKLAKETPNKPQVHYLLGYLREEENRFKEALESYRTAVKLDPDYLNAWSKIESIKRRVAMPAAERDAVVFNILRLDPCQRRGAGSFDLVSDLPALWRNVAAANSKRPAKPATLYPLPASKAELEKQKAHAADQEPEMLYQFRQMDEDRMLTPGKAIAQNAFLRAAQRLLGREGTDFDE